jgi:hypothetical protein
MKKNTFGKVLASASTFAFALVTLQSASNSLAAPMPATSSSKLVEPKLGIFRSPQGFKIGTGESGWVHSETPKSNKFISTMYKSPAPLAGKKDPAALTVRVDKLEKEISIDKYVQRWMKEYPKYGFDVLGSKSFVQGKDRGYFLDLLNRDSGRQLRQVVFLKKQKAVILTCRDQKASFNNALKACNQIVKTFQWTE